MPRGRGKRRRGGGRGGGRGGPPKKKRRYNDRYCKLDKEESKARCLRIVSTLQEALNEASLDLMARERITEADVGITEFLKDDEDEAKEFRPIRAKLKHRYEDLCRMKKENGNTEETANG